MYPIQACGKVVLTDLKGEAGWDILIWVKSVTWAIASKKVMEGYVFHCYITVTKYWLNIIVSCTVFLSGMFVYMLYSSWYVSPCFTFLPITRPKVNKNQYCTVQNYCLSLLTSEQNQKHTHLAGGIKWVEDKVPWLTCVIHDGKKLLKQNQGLCTRIWRWVE